MKVFILLIVMTSLAQAQDNGLTTKLDSTSFHAAVKDGFHFNQAAPNEVTIDGKGYGPVTVAPRSLDFKFENANFARGRAALYICDDAETYCRSQTIDLKGSAENSETSAATKAVTKNKLDFIEDNLAAAAAQAAKEKKLVLIDFSARWCPGCIRLENEVFETKDFKKASQPFVKVRLDYDLFENLKIAKQYNIRAIPSLLVATANLQEISRSVDYQPVSAINRFLKDAKLNPLPFAELQKKADVGDKKAALALGQRLYMGAQYAKSAEYLAQVKPEPVELRDAKVQATKDAAKTDEKLKPQYQRAARAAIAQEPTSTRSLIWRSDLAESLTDSTEKKKLGLEGLAVGDAILAHPEKMNEALIGDPIGEFVGYEQMYIASERADLAESAGLDEATQQQARLKVTELGQAAKIPVEKKGPSLRYLIFLTAAKQYAAADTAKLAP